MRGWRRNAVMSLVACALLAAAVAVPYAYFRAGLYTKSADESARTIEAWFWTFDKAVVKVDVWLPLHMMLTGLVLDVWPDLILAPRALNMALGMLLLPALAWLAHEIFRSSRSSTPPLFRPALPAYGQVGLRSRATEDQHSILRSSRSSTLPSAATPLLTMALAAFFGPRVVLSAVPLSEILFILLLTLGLAAMARWLCLGRLRWLLAAAAFIALSAGVRFEGWLFAAALGLFAAVWLHFDRRAPRSRRLLALAGAAVLLSAMPVYWCGCWYLASGKPFGFLALVGDRYWRVANPDRSFALVWEHGLLYQSWRQNLASLNIIGVAGVVLFLIRARRMAWWLAVPTAVFVVFAALTLTGRTLPTHNFWRIATPFSILLLPFTAHVLLAAAARLGAVRRPLESVMLACAVPVLLIAFHFQCHALAQPSEMDLADLEAGRFVREKLDAYAGPGRPRVFIEDVGVRTVHVKVVSNDPGAFLSQAPLESVVQGDTLDLDAIRARNVAVMVIRAEWAQKIQARLDAFSTAAVNSRWLLLALKPE